MIKLIENEPERRIEVLWDEKVISETNVKYQVNFTIKTYGRQGLLMDIMRILGEYKMDLTGVNTTNTKEDGKEVAMLTLSILVRKKEDFEKLVKHLSSMREIISIIRK